MPKKVRFPLEMENGAEVRSMEELRDNFSISKVICYLKEGKLVTWLRDRYANDIADLIEELDLQDERLAEKVSEIFDIPYDETSEKELEKATERAERIKKLKEYTDDRQYEKVVDNIAFDQDELYDLLDEDITTIYLCGVKFSIPLSKPDVLYIGINHPIVLIDSKVVVDWEEKGIVLENVEFDGKYKQLVENIDIGHICDENDFKSKNRESKYCEKTYMDILLNRAEQENAKQLFQLIKEMMIDVPVNLDIESSHIEKIIKRSGVAGIAHSFIEEL